ncbi:MAG TPA: LecA/PA-IL family lectin [Pyrinomonadaceae bacterium]|nr:LecA/PA-IL family lectin [Pyrinomonadaceae bacterium]
MSIKSKFFRLVCAACLVFSLSILTFADTIRLKDGSIIKGKIVGFSGGKFTIVMGQKQMSFFADEIESIIFDSMNNTVENVKISNQTTPSNSTVITVGQSTKTSAPQTSSPRVITTDSTPQNSQTSDTPKPTVVGKPKPIELGVKVLADNTANGWTNSGWVVRKGQRIRITSGGRVSLGNGRFATPTGITSLPDNEKLMKSVATGALIAVVGDDNNDFIYVGGEREFIAERDGALFLGVNEGNLDDNSGAFDVKIEIDPEISN